MIYFNDIFAYLLLLSAAAVWIATRNTSTTFVFLYLLSWEGMSQFLKYIGQYDGSLMPVFLGVLIDLMFIKIITEYSMSSKAVGPALLVSCVYGAGCLVEDALGGVLLASMYGLVMVILAGIVVTGGFYNDPSSGRMSTSGTWLASMFSSLGPVGTTREEKGQ